MTKEIKILVFALCWYIIGLHGFVYWWTVDHDFTSSEIPVVIVAGSLGPIAHVFGYAIHGKPLLVNTNVLIKKK